jgi:hypothetical protein
MMDRREFLKHGSITACLPLGLNAKASAAPESQGIPRREKGSLSWLEGGSPIVENLGLTWGSPWPQGQFQTDDSLSLINSQGQKIPLQTWPTAYWPDGSIKWTGHAVSDARALGDKFKFKKEKPLSHKNKIRIKSKNNYYSITNGIASYEVPKQGSIIISKFILNKRLIAQNAKLIAQAKNSVDPEEFNTTTTQFFSEVKEVIVEQQGPIRTVLKITGVHKNKKTEWLPFTLRLIFYAGNSEVKISHTFIYDGDDQKDFICGLGLRFEVIQQDEVYNRHIRFVADNDGIWAESPKGITGLRRDPGEEVRQAQIDGSKTPSLDTWDKRVSDRMHWIPEWNDYTLSQLGANGFKIKKRTKAGHAWIDADEGLRARGCAYLGGVSGGMLFGMRDFWQLYPVQIDIRNAAQKISQATLWFWSPEAQPMDVRFYHDGMGQDTYDKQLDALNITYEDYEPGFGSAYGVARTTDFVLRITESTPNRNDIVDWSHTVKNPPQIVSSPEDYLSTGIFGSLWSLPDSSNVIKEKIEQRLAWQVSYYQQQVEQRHWYGFWNYGDVMHTYDIDRHVWRYDVGGYAWDNSELSPDLWLWYSFLRSGDSTSFRLAEAMARHTRDVDIYHLGKFKGLGTRHNVQHWGCSAKQLRISTSAYRRFHYFLTADERTGDVINELRDAGEILASLDPTRKIKNRNKTPGNVRISLGTDWSAVAANWLTAWERTGDEKYKNRLINAMRAIGQHPQGFFAGTFGFDANRELMIATEDQGPMLSHLSAVFGLVEINAELNQLLDIPEYKRAWLQYCALYNADEAEQKTVLGKSFKNNLRAPHSRLTAYAASETNSKPLAKRAWKEFRYTQEFARKWQGVPYTIQMVKPPKVLNAIEEAPWLSTNDAAQWGLAAIQNLALIADHIE